jgi:hypothetical protein
MNDFKSEVVRVGPESVNSNGMPGMARQSHASSSGTSWFSKADLPWSCDRPRSAVQRGNRSTNRSQQILRSQSDRAMRGRLQTAWVYACYTSVLVLISELLRGREPEKNRKMKIGLLARATWDHASAGTKCCSPDTNVAAVAGLPWSGGCGAMPAGDSNQKLVGIVTDRDLCVALGTRDRCLPELGAGQAMSRSVAVCRFRVRR